MPHSFFEFLLHILGFVLVQLGFKRNDFIFIFIFIFIFYFFVLLKDFSILDEFEVIRTHHHPKHFIRCLEYRF